MPTCNRLTIPMTITPAAVGLSETMQIQRTKGQPSLWLGMSTQPVKHEGTVYYIPIIEQIPVAPDFLQTDPRYSVFRKPNKHCIQAKDYDVYITQAWGLGLGFTTLYGDHMHIAPNLSRKPTQNYPEHLARIENVFYTTVAYTVFSKNAAPPDFTDLSWMLDMQVPPLVILNQQYVKEIPTDSSSRYIKTGVVYIGENDPILRFEGGSYEQYLKWLTKHYVALNSSSDGDATLIAVDRGKELEDNFYVVDIKQDERSWMSIVHTLPFLQNDISRWILYLFLHSIPDFCLDGLYPRRMKRMAGIQGPIHLSFLAMKYPHAIIQLADDTGIDLLNIGKHIILPVSSKYNVDSYRFWDSICKHTPVKRIQMVTEASNLIHEESDDEECNRLLTASL